MGYEIFKTVYYFRHFLALKFKGTRNGIETDTKFEFAFKAMVWNNFVIHLFTHIICNI